MSEVKVNKVSPRSGTNVQLGDSGDTITIPSGATLDASSGGLAGTLTTAAQPNITSVGTLTSFSSTGIDDNATSTAMTISSGGVVSIGTTSSSGGWSFKVAGSNAPLELARTSGDTVERSHLGMEREGTIVGQFKSDATNLWLEASAGALIINTGGGSERMRIDSSGNVGIGTSSPDNTLDVTSSATPTVIIQSSATVSQDAILKIRGSRTGAVTNNCQIIFETNDSASGSEHLGFITAGKESGSNESLLAFGTTTSDGGTSTEKMRIDSSGHAIIPAGVTLGTSTGTYNAANTLDDYEEGTWTPVFRGSSGSGGGSSTTTFTGARYTKIGRLVFATVSYLRWSDRGGYSGDVRIEGLPFTANSTTTKVTGSVAWVKRVDFEGADENDYQVVVAGGTDYMNFYRQTSDLGTAYELTTIAFDDVLNSLHVSVTYETDA